MLTATNLCKQFPGERTIDAVQDLSFSLKKGEFLAIVGRSGSGKSTLLGMLGGISKPTNGSVLIDDIEQWTLGDDAHADFRNRKIGFVFQFASLLPTLRAVDNVALPALIGGTLDKEEAYDRAHALLERVGLSERVHFFPGQLSGGEQRRVAIARALINSPDIVLADEPTADLDEESEEEILKLLVDIHRAFNLTLVVVTHNPAIARLADRIIDMRAGRAVSIHTPSARLLEESSTDAGGLDSKIGEHLADPEAVESIRRMFEKPAAERTGERIRLGEGMERLLGRIVVFLIPLVLLAWGIHYGISRYEETIVDAKEEAHQALEELALRGLRADVEDITMGDGRSYDLGVYLRNTTGGDDIYVMSPNVRAFVQIGSTWQEIPLKPVGLSSQKVVKITGKQVFHFSLAPQMTEYAHLLPYYMHVRISNDMLVSPSSQPKNDLYERNDNYYVYLKPHGIKDEDILRKMKFPGKAPVWIPMPPH